jgi:hypothetical protein
VTTLSNTPAAGQTTIQITNPGGNAGGVGLAAALNANATFNSVLVANGTDNITTTTHTTTVAGTVLLNGTTTYAVSVILSKQVQPTNVSNSANWTVGSGVSLIHAIFLATTVNNNAVPSVVTPLFQATTPAQVIVHGTTTVNFTNLAPPVLDFAGNALAVGTLVIP